MLLYDCLFPKVLRAGFIWKGAVLELLMNIPKCYFVTPYFGYRENAIAKFYDKTKKGKYEEIKTCSFLSLIFFVRFSPTAINQLLFLILARHR